jgi:hypothetical protein
MLSEPKLNETQANAPFACIRCLAITNIFETVAMTVVLSLVSLSVPISSQHLMTLSVSQCVVTDESESIWKKVIAT